MPIVFGGAVTVNAIAAYLTLHKGETVNPLMWLGMAMVALGICLTAGYTPHGHPPAKPGAAPHADASSQADGASQGDPPSLEKH